MRNLAGSLLDLILAKALSIGIVKIMTKNEGWAQHHRHARDY